jgi:hypothetical protein
MRSRPARMGTAARRTPRRLLAAPATSTPTVQQAQGVAIPPTSEPAGGNANPE